MPLSWLFETLWTAAHYSGRSVLHDRPSRSPWVCPKFHIRPLLKLPWHEMSVRWLDDITDTMDLSWVGSESRWWTGKPEVLQFTGSQTSGMTEWRESYHFHFINKAFLYWIFFWQASPTLDIVGTVHGDQSWVCAG